MEKVNPVILTAKELEVHYGEQIVLDKASLSVHEEDRIGLVGRNGAGKSTVINILSTLLMPDEGTAKIFGHDVMNEAQIVRQLIGLTGQSATVDEKLQSTLEKRLGESFKQVSSQLESVYKGLGDMQNLAIGVGDLKRVLTNVKVRGTWGEVQLNSLLEQILV